MSVASMVIGIIAAILGFVPLCNYFAFIPAVIGLVLGIVDIVLKNKNQQPKGMAIAGITLNGIAILLIFIWTVLLGSAA